MNRDLRCKKEIRLSWRCNSYDIHVRLQSTSQIKSVLVGYTPRSADSGFQLEAGYCGWISLTPETRFHILPDWQLWSSKNTILYALTKSNLFRHSGFTTVDFSVRGKRGYRSKGPVITCALCRQFFRCGQASARVRKTRRGL